jgi:hypothetical protein
VVSTPSYYVAIARCYWWLLDGELATSAVSEAMGVSTTTVRKWLANHRGGRPDPVTVRRAMVERLATEHGAAAHAKRKTTVETVFGNVKANLGFPEILTQRTRRHID